MTPDNAIWKYSLPFVAGEPFELEIPAYGVSLSVQFQIAGRDADTGMIIGGPQLWVLINKTHNKVKRLFVIVGTGQAFDAKSLQYIGTWQDASYVWHLFEVLR